MQSTLLHAAGAHALRILFVGNSLLNFNDVPATVAKMLQSDGSGRAVTESHVFVGHLEDVAPGSATDREVRSGKFDVVVLQAAMVSSSGKISYPQTRAIAMAKAARTKGSRTLLYVEWPRRGVDETAFTLGVYRGIAQASGAELLPVCDAWNAVLAAEPKFELWSPDGNHALPLGSYLAACCVYFRLAGVQRTPAYVPAGLDAQKARTVLERCRAQEKDLRTRRELVWPPEHAPPFEKSARGRRIVGSGAVRKSIRGPSSSELW
ncbi:MAG: hypothetical protein M9921_09025 [Fimbriimonadaceae bacterium]|nr:hypothetical protein [Chthonomonadaceae bacterium]MCO5296987.1 hypothetical protein [Fimbriimonadaceae bacterium]